MIQHCSSLDQCQQHKKPRETDHGAGIELQPFRNIAGRGIADTPIEPRLVGKFAVIEARSAETQAERAGHRRFRPARMGERCRDASLAMQEIASTGRAETSANSSPVSRAGNEFARSSDPRGSPAEPFVAFAAMNRSWNPAC